MENNKILDDVLRELNASRLSHYKIGEETGITPESISNYRSGKTKPRRANLEVLANYFGISTTKCTEASGYATHPTEIPVTEAYNRMISTVENISETNRNLSITNQILAEANKQLIESNTKVTESLLRLAETINREMIQLSTAREKYPPAEKHPPVASDMQGEYKVK